MKRIISLFLTLLMIISSVPLAALPVSAATYTGSCGDNITWTLDDNGTLTISGTGTMTNYSSAPWYSSRSSVKSVVIENGVTSIGSSAFGGCSSLESVTIGGSVTSIGSDAFSYCSSLASIEIPDSVTSIGNSAFWGCSSLASIEIPDSVTSIGDSAFYECSSLVSVTIPDSVTSIGSFAFKGCSSLVSITISDSVTSIGGFAFSGCSSLESVTIPDSVTSIGSYAFEDCSSLTSIEIPDSVTSIGSYAFSYCSSLENVTIGGSVTSIGSYAFSGCSSLENVTIPDSVTSIGGSAFSNTAYYNDSNNWDNGVLYISNHLIGAKTSISGEYTIREGTKCIADSAFKDCSSLASITIPDSVTSIGSYAFSYCSSLENVTIGGSVTSIGWYAFSGCSSLSEINVGENNDYYKSVNGILFDKMMTSLICCPSKKNIVSYTIPDSVTSIGSSAFYYCTSLKSITIPDSVTSIGDDAFYYCSSLNAVYITDIAAWCSIDFYDGYSNPLNYANKLYLNGELVRNLIIPDSVTSIGSGAFYNCSSLASITIPDSVTSIGDSAFSYCSSLASITIPDSVTSIGSDAFYNCSSLGAVHITDIAAWCGIEFDSFDANPLYYAKNLYLNGELAEDLVIPDSVTSIGGYAFSGCSSLTSIEIGGSVTSIGNSAFSGCSSLVSVTIPDSVTSIGSSAFSWCSSLVSVTIPDSVTSIGGSAFQGCSSLTSIEIPDSVTSIGSSAFYNTAYYNDSNNWDNGVLYISNHLIKANTSISGEYTVREATKCIADRAFYNCSSLESVPIPDSVTSIGDSAFEGCSSLENVTIGGSVTSIGGWAFEDCSSLASITIGGSVTSIGSYAFYNCSSLASVTIGDSVTSIGGGAFSNTAYYNDSNNWDNGVLYISNHLIDEKTSISGEYTIREGTKCIADSAFHYCSSLKSVTIPDSVTSIGDRAFYNCSSIESVTIGGSVTSIGDYAFYDCSSLVSVTIPDSVTSIGDRAFYYCSSLVSVTIGGSVTSIGSCAFQGCSSLTSIEIPDSVTSIGDSAFSNTAYYNDSNNWDNGVLYISNHLIEAGTSISGEYTVREATKCIADRAFRSCSSLESVIIPDSVTSIGNYAFYDCGSLNHVFYSGTEYKWTKMDIADGNSKLTSATIHYECETGLETINYIEPTCEADGGYDIYCPVCDKVLKSVVLSAKGHNVDDNVCTVCEKRFDLIESQHPYPLNSDETKTITKRNAEWLAITFSEETETEEEYDFIYIYDGNDDLIGKYSGKELAGQRIIVNGDTFKICLTSDKNYNFYGYKVADVEYYYEACTHSNAEKVGAVEPTCTEAGSTGVFDCPDCYYHQEAEEIAASGHNYIPTVTAPTCTTEGFTTYTCTACGDSYTADETAVIAHSYEDGVCTVCGYVRPYTLGDPDDNGRITIADVLLIRKCIAGLTSDDSFNIDAADVDGNGRVTLADVLLVRKYIAGIITEFPTEK